jgi:hypothetical protein
MNRERRADAIAIALLALLPLTLFADVLLGRRCLYLRDLANYHHPAKKLLRDVVLGGAFPYWNPFFSAGQPFAANPQHEVFYPLTWLILLPDFELGFHLLIVVHLSIALCAMYALLRAMTLGRTATVLGALSFGLGGLTLSTLNLLPFLFSLAWMPLTCLYTRRFLRDGARRDAALAALFLGIQLVIGEPATALQTGILLGIYALWRNRARGVAAVALISIGALAVAAVQVVPAVDHFRDSVRSQKLDFRRIASWSMPLARAGEVLNPDLLGDPVAERPDAWRGGALYPGRFLPFYFSLYAGLLVTAAALAGIAARARGWGIALTILIVATLFAAGEHTPLLRALYDLGIGGAIRYPEKFFLMAEFTLIVFGARMIQALLDGDERLRKIMVVVVMLALVPALMGTNLPLALARVTALALLIVLFPRLPKTIAPVLLGAFVLLDLAPLLVRLAPRMPAEYYTTAPAAASKFPRDRDSFRIYNLGAGEARQQDAARYFEPRPGRYWLFRNALAPMTPAALGLRMVLNTDYDATALLPTNEFAHAAAELAHQQAPAWVDTIAAISNIRYVIVFRPFEQAFREAQGDMRRIEPVRVIEGHAYPRYFFATRMVAIRDRADFVATLAHTRNARSLACVYAAPFQPAPGVVRAWSESTNTARIDVEAAGNAFLVMSVTPHKYWRVSIDGHDAQAIVTNVGYQGVAVPAGRHVVEMRYRNPLITLGAAVSIVALLALLLAARL